MNIVYRGIRPRKQCSVITIGIFDGVHLGHLLLIKALTSDAKRRGCKSIVITFYPHPANILNKKFVPMLISLEHRLSILKKLGADDVSVIDFNRRFSRISAEDFIKNFLIKKFNLKELIVSEKFFFGKHRSGGIKELRRFAKKYKFILRVLKIKRYNGVKISSTLIRNLVFRGMLELASKLLGRPFSILGRVVKGGSVGKRFGYPTANISAKFEAVPPDGVYAVYVKLDGKIYKGALSIGTKPTFIKKRPKKHFIEVYILNFSKNIYKRKIEIVFVKWIRPQIKFEDTAGLYAQVARDVKKIGELLNNRKIKINYCKK